jgi:hypothetical protein
VVDLITKALTYPLAVTPVATKSGHLPMRKERLVEISDVQQAYNQSTHKASSRSRWVRSE